MYVCMYVRGRGSRVWAHQRRYFSPLQPGRLGGSHERGDALGRGVPGQAGGSELHRC